MDNDAPSSAFTNTVPTGNSNQPPDAPVDGAGTTTDGDVMTDSRGSEQNTGSDHDIDASVRPQRQEPVVSRRLGLSEVFGYSEDSDTNLLGLIYHVGGSVHYPHHSGRTVTLPQDRLGFVRREIAKMPPRPILDFLLQFFLTEVNWMTQLIHPPSFMLYYDSWWAKQSPKLLDEDIHVTHIDFTVLILRTCAFAAQFLPSPTYTVDSIRGMPLSQVREVCNTIGTSLHGVAETVNERGSLFRVQHLCFYAFNQACEGRLGSSWALLSSSIRVAHGLGYHRLAGSDSLLGDPLEREMKRRVFCNLYVWDGLLSRQLDRVSSFGDSFNMGNLPRMHLTPEVESESDAPEAFTERILQARLMAMWSCIKKSQGEDGTLYDPTQAQELHDWLQKDFVETLPPAFSLTNPDCKWDERLRHLPKQRQLIRATVGESICHLFRPLLRLGITDVRAMPIYKQVLLQSQATALTLAAFSILDASNKLHSLMGAMHTRLPAVVIYPFEAAVTLALLCIKDLVPREADVGVPGVQQNLKIRTNSVSTVTASSTEVLAATVQERLLQGQPVCYETCVAAVEETLNCLQKLSEISVLADGATESLSRLLSTIKNMSKNGVVDSINIASTDIAPSSKASLEQSQHVFASDSDMSLLTWVSASPGLHTISTADTTVDTLASEWPPFALSPLNDMWDPAVQDGLLSDWNRK
ncbi:trascription factor [Cordyceps javanica]|uniref:Trascription factor n=1 Tax=Cordyceps javanica TaxID=43265 RepID=A0A545VJD3_9HYPO|nr:trascription factor [Cordyceps javanica]TQW01837.1 trascription factor [Cordyceps javanica]